MMCQDITMEELLHSKGFLAHLLQSTASFAVEYMDTHVNRNQVTTLTVDELWCTAGLRFQMHLESSSRDQLC